MRTLYLFFLILSLFYIDLFFYVCTTYQITYATIFMLIYLITQKHSDFTVTFCVLLFTIQQEFMYAIKISSFIPLFLLYSLSEYGKESLYFNRTLFFLTSTTVIIIQIGIIQRFTGLLTPSIYLLPSIYVNMIALVFFGFALKISSYKDR